MTDTKNWRRALALTLIVCLGFSGRPAQAGWLGKLDVFGWFGKERVDTLLITGNFEKSRLLAELAQRRTKQPILLISPEAGGNDQIFFMPDDPEAMQINRQKVLEFVHFLQPRRVVLLGDRDYLPERYVDMLKDQFPSVLITGDDWVKNAEAVGRVVKSSRLAAEYADLLGRLQAARTGFAGGSAAGIESFAVPSRAVYPESPQVMP
jgi:hypothetical protein